MSLILDGLQFVKETTTTEGDLTPGSPVPSLTLLGPPDGFESIISKIGNGNEGFFFLRHAFAWMRFRGTVTTPDQLSVDEVLASSDAGNPLVLGPGTKQVYCALDEYSVGRIAGLTLLAEAVASGSATVDFESLITSDFDVYELHIDGLIPATDNTDIWLRGSTDNGSTYVAGTSYTYARHNVSSNSGATSAAGSGGDAKIPIFSNLDNTASRGFTGVVRFNITLNHFTFHGFGLNNDTHWHAVRGGGALITSAINAVRILMSTGNVASGTFRFYGVRKA